MRNDIRPGAALPDFELPDHTDTPRTLSAIQGPDPMVLVLLRGHFCPKDRQQLHELVRFHEKCRVGYTKLVTITTDTLLELNELRMGVGAHWPFLYDEERVIRDDLEIAEYTDRKNDPMIPYTFVLKPGLEIHSLYNGYWYWGRPTLDELHRDLRDVTRACRPDWAIDTPDARDRWDRGEKQSFFPYGRDMAELFDEY